MKRIIAATRNKHKIIEINEITKDFGMEIVSRDDAGISKVEIEEDGDTFEENSFKKANEIMKICGEITIADDSGLEVDYLNGAPGVYSARYAGIDGDDKKNRKKLIDDLEGTTFDERTGRFVSVITMVYPNGKKLVARGEVEGHILLEEIGENGFGYDNMFVPLGYDITFAQFSPEDKNSISHRGRALKKLRKLLESEE